MRDYQDHRAWDGIKDKLFPLHHNNVGQVLYLWYYQGSIYPLSILLFVSYWVFFNWKTDLFCIVLQDTHNPKPLSNIKVIGLPKSDLLKAGNRQLPFPRSEGDSKEGLLLVICTAIPLTSFFIWFHGPVKSVWPETIPGAKERGVYSMRNKPSQTTFKSSLI